MALRSLALRTHGGGASLLTLLSSVSRRHLSSVPRCRLPLPRPLVAAAKLAPLPRAAVTPRCLSTSGSTTSTINDPTPNWSNRPPKETILLDGCDFEHWLVVVDPPDPSLTRDEIIKSYIQTLAKVVGSDEEARFKIYSVSTKHYFAFGALVSEELSYKIKELPGVRWVLPDSYLDAKNKDYGGEPFINGEAVPYDPKYHEEWVRNNARAMERNRRNDRPRNFDRSRNFERRRENMQTFQNRSAPPPSPMQAQDTRYQPSPGPMNPGNAPGQGPVPSPMQAQDTRYQPSPGPMNPGNAPGQGPVPSPMNPQNTMPPPSSMPIPPPPPTPGPNESNMGGVNYSPYQNQMPQQSTIPPPMSGQNFQPGMPPRTSPNPNPNYGYQNQMPNYPNNPPPHANPSYRPSYPPGNNAYQGHQNAYQDGPPRYQGPPNSYPGNPGGYQVPPNRYPADSNGVIDQVGDGGNTGPYQGQDLPPGRRY